MLLEIATTHNPATDLGYLLHKHPNRFQTFDLSFGQAHVFYPEATVERCAVAMILDINPVSLVQKSRNHGGQDRSLGEYINDRPYVASSCLSVAIAALYGSALAGRSEERPELVETSIPLSARIVPLPCRGGEHFLRRLFDPLGYSIKTSSYALDEMFPDWGPSPYLSVELSIRSRLRDLLAHLYVLIPVLDDQKHYWVTQDEIEKLLHHGKGWLADHPERETITERYLKHQRRLTSEALTRLLEEDQPDPDATESLHAREEETVESHLGLGELRMRAVIEVLKNRGARRVLDLGCGEGRLIQELLTEKSFEEIVGVDVSHRALEVARAHLQLDRLPPRVRNRIRLLHGSLVYRDARLAGFDAAAIVEVIEHLDPFRLAAFERTVFEFARPGLVLVTTPNAEYNGQFEHLPDGQWRHRDHRFEWTRQQFMTWAESVARRFGYSVRYQPIGPEDRQIGSPTQMGVFSR